MSRQINPKKKYRARSRGFFLAVFLPLLLASCVKETKYEKETDQNTIRIELNSPAHPAMSRGLFDADEDNIKDITVLLFKQDKLLDQGIGRNIQNISVGETDKKTFEVDLDYVGYFTMVLLANVEDSLKSKYVDGVIPIGTTRAEIAEKLDFGLPTGNKWSTDRNSTLYQHIPMISRDTVVDIRPYATIKNIELTRAIAKVNVSVDANKVDNFELQDVFLYCYNTRGYLFDGVYKTKPSSELGKTTHEAGAVKYSKAQNELYLFEAENPQTYDNDKRVALVVSGYYDDSPVLSYYRIDFKTEALGYLDIIRNTEYQISIIEVKDSGWPDEDLAYHGYDADIVIELLDWEDGTLPWDSGWL